MRLIILLWFIPTLLYSQSRYPFSSSAHLSAGGGESLGEEMVDNGTFDDSTKWNISAGYTISGGVLTTDGDNNDYFYQHADSMVTTLSTSTDYRLTFDISNASGAINMVITEYLYDAVYVAADDYGNGNHSIDFTSPATLNYNGIRLQQTDGENDTGEFDNISLKEIL